VAESEAAVGAPRLDEFVQYTLEAIDGAIKGWIDQTADVHVEHPNGERKKVPVVISAGERWATGRTRGLLRDPNGVLILPIISIRRTGVGPDTGPNGTALGVWVPTITLSRRISPKTSNLQNLQKVRLPQSLLNPFPPVVHEIITVPFPIRKQIRDELTIQGQYISQVNDIIQKIYYECDLPREFCAFLDVDKTHAPIPADVGQSFGPLIDEPYVVGFLEEDLPSQDNFTEFTEQERIVEYTTSIRVPAALQINPEGERPAIRVQRSSFAINFSNERSVQVADPRDLDEIFGPSR
jgi:hypothetical protein